MHKRAKNRQTRFHACNRLISYSYTPFFNYIIQFLINILFEKKFINKNNIFINNRFESFQFENFINMPRHERYILRYESTVFFFQFFFFWTTSNHKIFLIYSIAFESAPNFGHYLEKVSIRKFVRPLFQCETVFLRNFHSFVLHCATLCHAIMSEKSQ